MISIKEIQHLTSMKEFQHLQIPLQDLKSATNNFAETNCIGHGGFGKVYKGEIWLAEVLTVVAIKRLDRSHGQGTPEFWREIMLLSRYKHRNLVSLLGFCDEGDENLLVYEYLSNKSLDLYLSSTDLSWEQRLVICHGAASGLKFLHEPEKGSRERILHRDIKSANILLDQDWGSKIADFGLSKLAPANQQITFMFSNAVGTMGYCDPLYAHTGLLTKESDVYSFGVVLFEVLCGRPCIQQHYNDIRKSLTALSRKCYEEKKMDTITYIGLKDTISPKCLERFSAIAYQCLHINRADRPSMGEIVTQLTIAIYYQYLTKISIPELPLKEIDVATGNFERSIWENDQYQIYKGELTILGKLTTVLIKRFRDRSEGDMLSFFLKQVNYLSYRTPPNIISLLGYCDGEKDKIIIHENAEHGSLDQYIRCDNTTSTTFTWLQRLEICSGAARGLYQLHKRDIVQEAFQSTNILLDSNWVAKVAGFMISMPSSTSLGHAYSAPEYIVSGMGTTEGDVYSLGMVLFEVLCGRLCTEDVDGYMLSAKLVKDLYEKKKLDEIIDPILKKQKISSYYVNSYSAIAYRCLLDDPKERPSMGDVIRHLEELLQTELFQQEQPLMTRVLEKLEIAMKNQAGEEEQVDRWSRWRRLEKAGEEEQVDRWRRLEKAGEEEQVEKKEFDLYEHQEFKYEHWELKLPYEITKIIKMVKFLAVSVTEKQVMWLFHKGILFNKGEMFFSIKDGGKCYEMMSARAFLYPASKMYEWKANSKFRFSEMARFPYKEQLKIQCRIKTRMLSPSEMYAASLVFSFQDEPQFMHAKSSHLMRINWKCEELNVSSTHFAEETEDGLMKIRLWHFVHGHKDCDFDVVLDKISYFEEDELPAIFIHGIEFEPVEMVEELKGLEDVSISDEDENWKKCIASDYQDIIQKSDKHLEYTTQNDLYLCLCAGILIENGQKWFSLIKSTGEKCHMIAALEIFGEDAYSYNKDFEKLSLPESRFKEVIQLQAGSSYSFECELEPEMFSSGNVYACYLVFKIAEDHVWHNYRRLVRAYCRLDTKETGMLFVHLNTRETVVNIPTITPKNYNDSSNKLITTKDPIMPKEFMDRSVHTWMKPRNDGWMEVLLSESSLNLEHHKLLSMTLNSEESDMYGIIVQGIEFRPMQRKNM